MLYSGDLGDNPLSTLRATALQVLRLVAHFCPLMPYVLPQRGDWGNRARQQIFPGKKSLTELLPKASL